MALRSEPKTFDLLIWWEHGEDGPSKAPSIRSSICGCTVWDPFFVLASGDIQIWVKNKIHAVSNVPHWPYSAIWIHNILLVLKSLKTFLKHNIMDIQFNKCYIKNKNIRRLDKIHIAYRNPFPRMVLKTREKEYTFWNTKNIGWQF